MRRLRRINESLDVREMQIGDVAGIGKNVHGYIIDSGHKQHEPAWVVNVYGVDIIFVEMGENKYLAYAQIDGTSVLYHVIYAKGDIERFTQNLEQRIKIASEIESNVYNLFCLCGFADTGY